MAEIKTLSSGNISNEANISILNAQSSMISKDDSHDQWTTIENVLKMFIDRW
jgi:hypothetical protein